METQPSSRNEFVTIFVAAATALLAMSILIIAMVNGSNDDGSNDRLPQSPTVAVASVTDQTETKSPKQHSDPVVEKSSDTEFQVSNASFSNVSSAPLQHDFEADSPQPRTELTATELHNTLRDLFRVPRQKHAELSPIQQQTSRKDQVLAVLNDPTLKSQSPIWKFLFQQTDRDQSTVASVEAANRLAVFLPRAFRRPVSDIEVEQFVKRFDELSQNGESFQESMAAAVESALMSPEFLCMPIVTDKNPEHIQYATASRLSYLLWETMPTDYLLMAAREGRLSDHRNIRREVRSMLSDERSLRFARRFGTQWLGKETLTNDQLALLHSTFSGNKSILALVEKTENSDALKTLAKTDQPDAKWVLEVLLYRDRQTNSDEASDRKLLKDWMGIDIDDLEQIRQMVLNNREVYTDSFVRHLFQHTSRLFDNSPTLEVQEISNTVMFNQYLAHNLVEEVIVNATLGSKDLSSISRKLTAGERLRR